MGVECHGQGIVSPWEPPVDMKKTRSKLASIVERKNKIKRAQELKGRFPDRDTPDRIATTIEDARLLKMQKLKQSGTDGTLTGTGTAGGSAATAGGGRDGGGSGLKLGSVGEGITDESTGTMTHFPDAGYPLDPLAPIETTPIKSTSINSTMGSNDHINNNSSSRMLQSQGTPGSTLGLGSTLQGSESESRTPSERPRTNAQQRRAIIAEKVARDGKFVSLTKRPATSSSLWLPLRKPEAPIYGTEEQNNILRIIASQGKDFELVAKTKTVNIYEKLGIKESPNKSSIGVYCDAVQYGGASDRDKYLHSLTGTHSTPGDLVDPRDTAKSDLLDGVATRNALKTETIDMVGNRRRRFVDKILMPPKHLNSYLEDAHEREILEEEKKRKLILEKNKNLMHKDTDTTNGTNGTNGSSVESGIDNVADQLGQRMKFLKPVEVKYGKGRLRSTHNLRGKITEPWTTVQHNYAVKSGDRTG